MPAQKSVTHDIDGAFQVIHELLAEIKKLQAGAQVRSMMINCLIAGTEDKALLARIWRKHCAEALADLATDENADYAAAARDQIAAFNGILAREG